MEAIALRRDVLECPDWLMLLDVMHLIMAVTIKEKACMCCKLEQRVDLWVSEYIIFAIHECGDAL